MTEPDRIAAIAERIAKHAEQGDTEAVERELGALAPDDLARVKSYAEQKAAHHAEQAEADFDQAAAFEWATSDPLEILDAGSHTLEELGTAREPAGLLAALDLMAREQPRAVASALFAAVTLTDYNDRAPAIQALSNEWFRAIRGGR